MTATQHVRTSRRIWTKPGNKDRHMKHSVQRLQHHSATNYLFLAYAKGAKVRLVCNTNKHILELPHTPKGALLVHISCLFDVFFFFCTYGRPPAFSVIFLYHHFNSDLPWALRIGSTREIRVFLFLHSCLQLDRFWRLRLKRRPARSACEVEGRNLFVPPLPCLHRFPLCCILSAHCLAPCSEIKAEFANGMGRNVLRLKINFKALSI